MSIMGHCTHCGEGVIVFKTRESLVEDLEFTVLVLDTNRKPSGQMNRESVI